MALHSLRRRQFCGSLAALIGVGFAGCTRDASGIGGSDPEDTPITETCEREHQELPDLVLENEDSQRHTIELTVTGEREHGSSELFFEETYDLMAGREAVWGVAFDPDANDIERYDDLVATASTEDGSRDTESVYSTVVDLPLRYGLEVWIDSEGQVHAEEIHMDTGSDWEPAC